MRKVFCLLCLLLSALSLYSARQIKRNGAYNLLAEDKVFFYRHELSAYAMPNFSHISFHDIDGIGSKPSFSCGAGIDYRFFFIQYVGFSIGAQWQPYRSRYDFRGLTLSEYGIGDPLNLSATEPYEFRSQYMVQETFTAHFVDLPVKFVFVTPSYNRMQFRLALGYCYGMNIATSGKLSGHYLNMLHYRGVDEDEDSNPALKLGKQTDMNVNKTKGQLSPHHSLLAELGIGVKLNKRLQLNIDAYGLYALNNLQGERHLFKGMDEKYDGILSTTIIDINSDVRTNALGIRAGLSVYLGKEMKGKLPEWKKRRLEAMRENSDFLADTELGKDADTSNVSAKDTISLSDAELSSPKDTASSLMANNELQEEKGSVDSANVVRQETSASDAQLQAIRRDDVSFTYHINSTEILFYVNTTMLKESSQAQLLELVRELKISKPKKIFIVGHTCNVGSDAANVRMGKRRAAAVKNFLVENGLDDTIEVEVISKGSKEPKYPNNSDENRERNRRVEFDLEY